MPTITLNENALTTLSRLKSYLSVSGDAQDSLLIMLINGTSAWIEKRCDRSFKKAAYTDYLKGSGAEFLFLKGYPIIGGVTLYENDSGDTTDDFQQVDSDLFWILDEEGTLEANGFVFVKRQRAYKAIYEAGYIVQGATVTGENIELPEDLEMACWRLIAGIYNQRKAEGTSGQSLGDYSVQFSKLVDSDPTLQETFANYRRPAL